MGNRIVRRLMLMLGGAMAMAGGSATPAQAFEAQGPLTAGFTSVCAIAEQNSISCWGDNNAGHTSGAGAASGAFRTVVTGWSHTCAIDAAASISCWVTT